MLTLELPLTTAAGLKVERNIGFWEGPSPGDTNSSWFRGRKGGVEVGWGHIQGRGRAQGFVLTPAQERGVCWKAVWESQGLAWEHPQGLLRL